MSWKRVILILIVVGIVAAVAAAIFLRPQEAADEAPTVGEEVDTITVDTDTDLVAAEGDVLPLQSAQLSFPQAGQVAELFVDEGDIATEGAPLVRLDSADQEIAVQQATAGVAQAQANLASAEAGLKMAQTGRRLAELGVAAAEAQLDLAKAGASPEQIALSEQAVAAAQAGVSAASGSQAAVLEGSTSAQLFAAEAELRAAEALQKSLQDTLGNAKNEEKERVQQQLNAATAGVSAAQSALSELQAGATQAERLAASAAVSQAIAQSDAAQAQVDLLMAGTRAEQIEVGAASGAVSKLQYRPAAVRVGVPHRLVGNQADDQVLLHPSGSRTERVDDRRGEQRVIAAGHQDRRRLPCETGKRARGRIALGCHPGGPGIFDQLPDFGVRGQHRSSRANHHRRSCVLRAREGQQNALDGRHAAHRHEHLDVDPRLGTQRRRAGTLAGEHHRTADVGQAQGAALPVSGFSYMA